MGDAVDQILAQWARERPDLDCSPMGVIGRISQLQREVHLAQRATFARHGLDVPSFDVLAALRRAGAPYQLTPTALMRTALVTSGAITDSGHSFADPLAGFWPAHGDDLGRGGMGLWLARKLWDSVDLLPGPDGLTVRLGTRLYPA